MVGWEARVRAHRPPLYPHPLAAVLRNR
ncbi:hypothetical protein E2C01_060624 [Portunus trituberculatus]|uniref:Uncharacterized protein n=1 Tax=Portunus trituberculatus TaxID=210409 RepID=A0A5B7H977_PORTR|nr:hypothetical protein [Portunus trituberculatus]